MAISCKIISQPQGARFEIKGLLRNRPSSVKPFRSPIATPCENFRNCETHLWHTSSISQLRKPLRNHQGPQKLIFAAQASFRSCENPCETPLAHECHFAAPLFSQLRNGLRKWPLAAKRGLRCEITPHLRKIPTITWLLI